MDRVPYRIMYGIIYMGEYSFITLGYYYGKEGQQILRIFGREAGEHKGIEEGQEDRQDGDVGNNRSLYIGGCRDPFVGTGDIEITRETVKKSK